MRAKFDRQPLTDQERDTSPEVETDQEESDIAEDDGEEDTDDESIDVPPNPDTQAIIEKLRAENTMLREMAARREVVRKDMQEYKEKMIEMIRELSSDSGQPETADNEEQKRMVAAEIMEMLAQIGHQSQNESEKH